MADWYVSSAAYAGVTAFQTSHAYNIGDLIKPTSPAYGQKWVFRCTTTGTSGGSEPTWNQSNNGTTTSGTAVFTNITGQSTYGWAAAAGDLFSVDTASSGFRATAGDRLFLSSDHTDSGGSAGNITIGYTPSSFLSKIYISVNRAGSVPPVAADVTAGAVIANNTSAGNFVIATGCPLIFWGVTISVGGGNSGSSNILFQSGNAAKPSFFKNSALYLNCTNASAVISFANSSGMTAVSVWDNTTVQFGSTTQWITVGTLTNGMDLTWINTPSAIVGTPPSALFNAPSTLNGYNVVCRGVDLSALTGTLIQGGATGGGKFLFECCKIASGVSRYVLNAAPTNTHDLVELVSCYDGTNIISESYTTGGSVTTDLSTTLSGGAADNVGSFAHKIVSNANVDLLVGPLDGYWLDVENTATGSAKTATVEILSSGPLTNADVGLFIEFDGTSGSSLAKLADSTGGPLGSIAAAAPSTATWNNPPAGPAGFGGFASSTSVNESTGAAGASSIYLTKITLNNAQTVNAVWLNVSTGANQQIKAVIYDSSHSALLAVSGTVTTPNGGICRMVLTSPWSAAAGTYYVGYVSWASGGPSVYIDSSQTGSSWWVSGGQSISSPANPLSGGSSQNNGLQIALEFVNGAQNYGWSGDYSANVALSGSNGIATFSSSGIAWVRSARSVGGSGFGGQLLTKGVKTYCEVVIGGTVDSNCFVGVIAACVPNGGTSSDRYSILYNEGGSFSGTGNTNSGTPSSWTAGDVIGICIDGSAFATTGLVTIWFNKNNGSWFGSSGTNDPANGLGGVTLATNSHWWPLLIAAGRGASGSTAAVYTLHDQPSALTYAPPSGFFALGFPMPSAQKLQVSFTPQHAGRVRGQVRLGTPSDTLWYDPQLTVT